MKIETGRGTACDCDYWKDNTGRDHLSSYLDEKKYPYQSKPCGTVEHNSWNELELATDADCWDPERMIHAGKSESDDDLPDLETSSDEDGSDDSIYGSASSDSDEEFMTELIPPQSGCVSGRSASGHASGCTTGRASSHASGCVSGCMCQ